MSEQETTTQTPDEASQVSAASIDAQTDAGPGSSQPASGVSQAAPLLMGVKLPIRVLLGRTQLSLRDIAQLGSGAVVELDCSPDDPVEIIVNGRVIASGEVVVVSGNYGVRITKIGSRRGDSEAEQDNKLSSLFSLSQKLR
jgi:flagellar motor switch protein FliN/FliY